MLFLNKALPREAMGLGKTFSGSLNIVAIFDKL
jgi:hypothetical protein